MQGFFASLRMTGKAAGGATACKQPPGRRRYGGGNAGLRSIELSLPGDIVG